MPSRQPSLLSDRTYVDSEYSLSSKEALFCHPSLAGHGTVLASFHPAKDLTANMLQALHRFLIEARTSTRPERALCQTGWFRSWVNKVACSIVGMCRSWQAWN